MKKNKWVSEETVEIAGLHFSCAYCQVVVKLTSTGSSTGNRANPAEALDKLVVKELGSLA